MHEAKRLWRCCSLSRVLPTLLFAKKYLKRSVLRTASPPVKSLVFISQEASTRVCAHAAVVTGRHQKGCILWDLRRSSLVNRLHVKRPILPFIAQTCRVACQRGTYVRFWLRASVVTTAPKGRDVMSRYLF